MRGQGLSINMIVIIAIAALVLIFVVMMLYRGQSSSNAINSQNVINNCRSLCVQEESLASNYGGTVGQFDKPSKSAPKYCSITFKINGETEHCYNVYTCKLIDSDGDSIVLNKNECNNWK